MAYLTQVEWKARTAMPAADVDALESAAPGWVALQLDEWSDYLDARLRKRYRAPFSAPYPKAVLRWLEVIVTARAYFKRGFNASDPTVAEVFAARDVALAEVKEAADAVEGAFDLPTNAAGTTAVSKGGPRSYSEASPYVGLSRQAADGRRQDLSGSGDG